MSKYRPYRPNYAKLYPGVEISDEVLTFLKQSDRQIEYFEFGLKSDRYLQDKNGLPARDEYGEKIKLPEREVSLEKLREEDWDFKSNEPTPEEALIASEEAKHFDLYRAIDTLTAEERDLVQKIFFESLTEQVYAESIGITQQAVNKRRKKILEKLKFAFLGC